MAKLSDNDKTKIRNLEYAFLELLTQQKQRMYPHDKDITLAYEGIKKLKASFQ